MTSRKFKKLLMSYGIDRDLAEVERKNMSRIKKGPFGPYMQCDRELAMRLAAHRVQIGCRSYRKYRQYIKQCLKNTVVV